MKMVNVKKSELRNFDIVTFADGDKGLVNLEQGLIICNYCYCKLDELNEDLVCEANNFSSIVEVERPNYTEDSLYEIMNEDE